MLQLQDITWQTGFKKKKKKKEMIQARREWQDIFKILKGKNLHPRILHPAKLSFDIEGEIMNFSDKQKLKEHSNTKPILKEILKGRL